MVLIKTKEFLISLLNIKQITTRFRQEAFVSIGIKSIAFSVTVLSFLTQTTVVKSQNVDFGYDNQWTLSWTGSYYNIKNRVTNLCLGVRGVDNHSAGTGAEVYYCYPGNGDQGLDNQWSLVGLSNGYYNIKNRVTGLCLGVRGVDSHSAGTGAEVYYCYPGNGDQGLDNQWSLVALGNGYYNIKNWVSGLCLGVRGVDNHNAGEEAEVYYCNP